MPRRKNTDGEAGTNNTGQPVKQPRVRKKKEPSSICSTPTTDLPPSGMKLEPPHPMGGMPPGCGPGLAMDGPMGHGMLGGPPGMHLHPALQNGTPCGPGGTGPAPHQQPMMEDGGNGPGAMGFAGGMPHPQGPPFDFYQQGPVGSGAPPHFAPPQMQMYASGPPPGPPQQMMMAQQQQGPPQSQMGPPHVAGPGQFHPGGPEQEHPHPQMMPAMHPHHPGAQPGPGPMSAPPGPQMAPHQMPPPPPHPAMFPPGAFPRQPPGPMMLFPPPPSIPQPPFLEFRLQEMNRRFYQFHSQYCQQASTEHHDQFWDAFSHEFFDDIGRMTLLMHEYSAEQGGFVRRQYIVTRRLIPRFYRSLFNNGVNSLHYIMRSPAQEMVEPQRMHNPEMFGSCALNCENLLMVIGLDKPIPAEVHIECRLYVEFAPFTPNLGYRVRHWLMELRSHQEYFGKDGMAQQLDGMERKLVMTVSGLPIQTHAELRMWQIVQGMEPIIEKSKDTNESPQLALNQIVMEGQRMEMERQQRMAQAQAAAQAHIQTPPHNPGSVGAPPQHPMATMMSGMGPPQMGPPGMQMLGMPPQQPPPMAQAEEPKPKPKRVRQRKTTAQQAAAAAAMAGAGQGGGTGPNSSPPKGKKGGQATAAAQRAGQMTPPVSGIPPQIPGGGGFVGPPMGTPQGQFAPNAMPPGQYHHDVLTVGEPSMMGCEYGEQDERQISRVENTAFAGIGHGHPSVSQPGGLMLPPQGMSVSGPLGMPQMTMASMGQQQMAENAQSMLGDFDLHSQHQQQLQLQQQPPNSSIWGQPPQSDVSQQQAMSSSGS